MTLLPAFEWIAHTGPGVLIQRSTYAFPVLEVLHLMGLTLLLGVVLTLDLRLLGVGLRRQAAPVVVQSLSPAFWAGLALTLGSGTILFIGEPVKCFFNLAFWWKMGLLIVALAVQTLLFHRAAQAPRDSAAAGRLIAILSLVLWSGVGLAGRAIGFI